MPKENRHNNQKKGFKIPNDVKELLKLNYKKYKKQHDDYSLSKKEMKELFYAEYIDRLPETIAMLIKYGNVNEVREIKDEIYKKIVDTDFIKYLTKELKKYDLEFDNMILLPVIIYDVQEEITKTATAMKAENPSANVDTDVSDLIDISRIILKKRIKKFVKEGIDESLAFDLLSVLPNSKILEKSPNYHLRRFFGVIYEHAKVKEIDINKIMKMMFKDDEADIATVITYALLERKEKIVSFTEGQKKVFNDITEYCFKTLEEMNKSTINAVLKSYVEARKRDDSQNKDSNRRYYISSLPESDYPRITRAVMKICENEELKKYF